MEEVGEEGTGEDGGGSMSITSVIISPCEPYSVEETFKLINSWGAPEHIVGYPAVSGGWPTAKMQRVFMCPGIDAEVLAYIHNDVEIYEAGWRGRVEKQFEDPEVGVVGFGGATQLGVNDIYKLPYDYRQLVRINYLTNDRRHEIHGHKFTGECDVAALDGFCLIVRRKILDRWGLGKREQCGWPVDEIPFHNYDNALCLEARRQGYRVRLVGVDCRHNGGRHSTTPEWQQRCKEIWNKSDWDLLQESHKYLYEEYRDVLPIII